MAMNYRKQIRVAQQVAQRDARLAGEGSYLFANNTKGDYTLPRPAKDGTRVVRKDGQFVGDDYYFSLLKTGDLRLVKDLKESVVAPVVAENKEYVFQNRHREDLHLPTPSNEGLVIVAPRGEFTGDSRYFSLMREGRIQLVKEVNAPMSEKLITEQPPTVTHNGKVEYVVEDGQLTEQQKKDKEKLLAEKSLEGVKLLLD